MRRAWIAGWRGDHAHRSFACDGSAPNRVIQHLRSQGMNPAIVDVKEQQRLRDAREAAIPWKKWGPYLSERQWGTVREDYSEDGDAWNFFTHDHARSRAYRWGEDGMAGISDDHQRLCFALALWNGKDPILKERLFGLTNSEGNHGEDVKEYYFYLDSTPTHSYMKYLYKYPQAAYPYADLVDTNRRRNRDEMEYELLDTGVFNDDRYFDVFVEYAKAGPEDILVRITAANRGPDAAELHLLPTLWFRNDWSTWIAESNRAAEEARPRAGRGGSGHQCGGGDASAAGRVHPLLRRRRAAALHGERNQPRAALPRARKNESPYVKDGINDCVVHGQPGSREPRQAGHQGRGPLPGQGRRRSVLGDPPATLRRRRRTGRANPSAGRSMVFADRLREADEFYASVTPPSVLPTQPT